MREWRRYVALGDSITEGFCDPAASTQTAWLGWADRLAVILDGSAVLRGETLHYANLAVRGRRIDRLVQEQIPAAIEARADLVSVMIGGNDLMSAQADPDRLAARLEAGIADLRRSGADVLLSTCFDPRFAAFLKPLRGRAGVFNANLWGIAREHGTFMLDVWSIREFQQRSMWSADRVHPTPAGHRLLAARAAHSLGLPYWELPAQEAAVHASVTMEQHPSTLTWFARHALPWFGRRVRGISAGDGLSAKAPTPVPVRARR